MYLLFLVTTIGLAFGLAIRLYARRPQAVRVPVRREELLREEGRLEVVQRHGSSPRREGAGSLDRVNLRRPS